MTFCAANVFRYFLKLGLYRKQWSKECQAAYQETGWMVWNDKRPQGSGVSINYHWRSSHKRCSQFTKPVRASNNNAGAWRGKTPSHFWFILFGHLANNSARSLFCEPIRIQGKYIHVAGSRGAGNECEKVAIGLLWLIRKQVVNSVNQSEHDAKTFCWFQARENAGELWLVEKVLVARIFFKPIITRINVRPKCEEQSDWKKWGGTRRTLFQVMFLFVISDFLCLFSFPGICFLLLVKILKRLILLDRMAG